MMKKAIGIIVILFLQFNIVFAQNSFEIEALYSLTSEKLVTSFPIDNMNSQWFHSFGINGKKIFKSNLFLQSGVLFRNFGTGIYDPLVVVIDDAPTEIIAKSIDIPISIGYYFLNRDKVRLGISLGINNGFLLNQYQNYHNVILEDIRMYNDYILQFNTSVEIGIRLTDHVILNIKSIFQRQINSNNIDYKQRVIGCQLGVSYDFGK